jgi:hypothetical protein
MVTDSHFLSRFKCGCMIHPGRLARHTSCFVARVQDDLGTVPHTPKLEWNAASPNQLDATRGLSREVRIGVDAAEAIDVEGGVSAPQHH